MTMTSKQITARMVEMRQKLPSTGECQMVLWTGQSYAKSNHRLRFIGERSHLYSALNRMGVQYEDVDYSVLEPETYPEPPFVDDAVQKQYRQLHGRIQDRYLGTTKMVTRIEHLVATKRHGDEYRNQPQVRVHHQDSFADWIWLNEEETWQDWPTETTFPTSTSIDSYA